MKNFITSVRSKIVSVWDKINPVWQERIISGWHTFASSFITVIAITLSTGKIEWSWAFFGSLALAGVRAGWKALWAMYAPVSLGGVKGSR